MTISPLSQSTGRALRRSTILSVAVAGAAAIGVVISLGFGALVAHAASPAISVTPSQIASQRPADGGWWASKDDAGIGSFAVTDDSYTGDSAMKLSLASTSAKVYIQNDYPAADRPTDILALLQGANYTYTGTNVNFQLEVIFKPVDSTHGPNPVDPTKPGAEQCDSANAWGFTGVGADWCYTVLKWEPQKTSSTWATVDLSQDVASSSDHKTGGWITQKRVGSIAKPGSFNGQKISDILAQMSTYQVTSRIFGAGSGTAGPVDGWVKGYTIGGTAYQFVPDSGPVVTPNPPAPAPAASDAALDQLIADQHIDVAATSSTFSLDGAAPGSGLDAVDPSKPISASLPWTASGDDFVDVYAYSSPVYLGTFPVVNGRVVLTGLDISALEAGGHHLVFQGQTSGTIAVVAITVQVLAATGANAIPYVVIGAILLLLGIAAVVVTTVVRRRNARRV